MSCASPTVTVQHRTSTAVATVPSGSQPGPEKKVPVAVRLSHASSRLVTDPDSPHGSSAGSPSPSPLQSVTVMDLPGRYKQSTCMGLLWVVWGSEKAIQAMPQLVTQGCVTLEADLRRNFRIDFADSGNRQSAPSSSHCTTSKMRPTAASLQPCCHLQAEMPGKPKPKGSIAFKHTTRTLQNRLPNLRVVGQRASTVHFNSSPAERDLALLINNRGGIPLCGKWRPPRIVAPSAPTG